MADNVRQLRERGGESEKITINLGYVDLGRIDLLVQEGFYSNRTDFIRTAIRNQLGAACRRAVALDRAAHARARPARLQPPPISKRSAQAGETLHIKVIGLARIAPDVTPELAPATIGSLTVLGALQASAEVKAALSDRIK